MPARQKVCTRPPGQWYFKVSLGKEVLTGSAEAESPSRIRERASEAAQGSIRELIGKLTTRDL